MVFYCNSLANFVILAYNGYIMNLYYNILFVVSIVLACIYAVIFRKRYSIYITLIFILVPITIRGYILQSTAVNLGQAVTGVKLAYQGASFLLLFMMFTIFDLCNLNLSKRFKLFFFILSWLMYFPVLTVGSAPLFYKSVSLEFINGEPVIVREYGPFHTVFYIFLAVYLAITIGAIVYALKKKRDVSKKNLLILLFCEGAGVLFYLGQHIFSGKIDFSTLSYLLTEIILLIIITRISLYDITETAIDTISMNGGTGFVSFDNKFSYIASNKLAKQVFPALQDLWVDSNAAKMKK